MYPGIRTKYSKESLLSWSVSASEINSDAYSLAWHTSDIIYICLAVRLGIRKFIKERLRINYEKIAIFDAISAKSGQK